MAWLGLETKRKVKQMSIIMFIAPVLLSVASWFGIKYLTRNVAFLDDARNSMITVILVMFVLVQFWNVVLHKFFP
jgi:uncharacterized membrane protein